MSENQIQEQNIFSKTPIYTKKLLGHVEQINFFCDILNNNTLGKAYLLKGKFGIGKETFALMLARAIITKEMNRDAKFSPQNFASYEPENYVFKGTINNIFDNFFYLKKETILIEDISEIIKFLNKKTEHKKCIVIDSAEKMNISATNALLKSLEDSFNSVFIFTSSHEEQILKTIRSRCIEVQFKNLEKSDVETFLRDNLKNLNDESLKIISEISDGSIGIATKLSEIGTEEFYAELLNNFMQKIPTITGIQKENFFFTTYLLQYFISKILMHNLPKTIFFPFEEKIAQLIIERIKFDELIEIYSKITEQIKSQIQFNLDQETVLRYIYAMIYEKIS